jgi:hypothetical protein
MTTTADDLIDSMDQNPEMWEVDKYRACHSSGISIWIGNGWYYTYVERPSRIEFGFWEVRRLGKALDRLKSRIVKDKLLTAKAKAEE